MPIDHEHLMSLRARGESVRYTDRDTMLYALATGFGSDPSSQGELAYVFEQAGPRTMPAMGAALLPLSLLDDCGWDAARVTPVGVEVALDRPLDPAGSLLVDSEVAHVHDRGAGDGAAITVCSRARRERDGQLAFTVWRTMLARGDGGFGGPRSAVAGPHQIPDRPPDMAHTTATLPGQALLFRLLNDRNPLHASPDAARAAGLRGPSLHSQCVFGIACQAVLRVICELDHTLMTRCGGAWTGPVYPGESVLTEIWQDANIVSFRVRVPARDALVMDHGRCVLAT